MFDEILMLLLDFASGLLGGACLLRAYLQAVRAPLDNPPGRFVQATTDWLVQPLRRVFGARSRWDWASLVGAWLIKLAQFVLLWALHGASVPVAAVLVLALFGVGQLAISVTTVVVLLAALVSWMQPSGPMAWLLERMAAPLLAPLRRVIPLVGGVDLSPLALLVLLQIAAIVLANLQHMVLGLGVVLAG